jgi:hypothetical protein
VKTAASWKITWCSVGDIHASELYRGADKSLVRPGRKQATATEDFNFIYPICNHNWRNIITIYMCITRLDQTKYSHH